MMLRVSMVGTSLKAFIFRLVHHGCGCDGLTPLLRRDHRPYYAPVAFSPLVVGLALVATAASTLAAGLG
jgi:hypothetical protein